MRIVLEVDCGLKTRMEYPIDLPDGTALNGVREAVAERYNSFNYGADYNFCKI